MNIHRNPLGARNFEYYSEDPVVTGNMAAGMVRGIQSAGVGTSVKHFAANNQETNRNTVNTIVSERALREIYLRGWQIVTKKAEPWTIMSSYNKINGVYTSQSGDLLNNILRNEWGYKGFVMTDWFGGNDAVEQMKAGNNLLMPGRPEQTKMIMDAVVSGKLDQKIIDKNVEDILNIVLKTPVYKGYKYSEQPDLKKNARLSRQAAAESMVLLKNDGSVLPLGTDKRKVAVLGNNSFDLVAGGTGSGAVNTIYVVPLVEGIFKAGYVVDPSLYSAYSSYLEKEKASRPAKNMFEEFMNPTKPISEMDLEKTVLDRAAELNDVAVVSIGRNAGEGTDRKLADDYYFSEKEKQILRQVADAFHAKGKKLVVVLNVGGVVDVAQWRDLADAILLAWQPGLEGGNAIADVLAGKVNPSGKLATSFPASYNDVPSSKNFPGREFKDKPVPGMMGMPAFEAEVVYEEGIYVGYRYYNTFNVKPAYEFGYGLSYTSFSYSDLKLSSKEFAGSLTATVTVTNTGKVAGKEAVQVYISAPAKKMDKPVAELKLFGKTRLLEPGQSETLTFVIGADALASFDTKSSAWIAEAGDYAVKIGASSADIRQSASFKLAKELIVEKTTRSLVPQVPINELKPVVKK
jgi:beta-glucosidase